MCDIAVVVRPEGVLFAKNSDRDANEAQLLEWHPQREGPAGSRVTCTWIEIEEAPRRHAVLLSRPFWTWGAEMGANEHGLVVGNVAVFTKERVGPPGLTGMDLVRLALERATDAEEAARVIAWLIETHGQGGGCGHENRRFAYHNSFVLADPRRALLVETAGKAVAVERVAGARTISNALTPLDLGPKATDRYDPAALWWRHERLHRHVLRTVDGRGVRSARRGPAPPLGSAVLARAESVGRARRTGPSAPGRSAIVPTVTPHER